MVYTFYLCNRYKGSDIASLDPATQELVRLFRPQQDRWDEHFQIVGPVLEPLTPIRAATARLLRLNAAARVERQLLQSLARHSCR